MKVFVINLDREVERMSFQRDQAELFELILERIPAFDKTNLAPPANDPIWQKWQRPLRDVEKAAALSHRSAWLKTIAENAPCLILEDDAVLMPGTDLFLRAVEKLIGVDHLSLETRGRKKILGGRHQQFPAISKLLLDRTGAAAYVLWPEGARKLLQRFAIVPALADAMPVETPGLKRWQADPAMAAQIDIVERYGLIPPLPVNSSISNSSRPVDKSAVFKWRRFWSQAKFLIPHLRVFIGAKRKEVLLKTEIQTSKFS